MAVITGHPTVELHVRFAVTESEARALDALVGYGDDAFIEAFKDQLGQAYLRDHEAGLRSFFQSIRADLPNLLERADKAKAAFNE